VAYAGETLWDAVARSNPEKREEIDGLERIKRWNGLIWFSDFYFYSLL
jgi:hypothetical protein